MFIIPVGDRVNWKRPPIITLLLILVNCYVFFALQGKDAQHEQQAGKYYFSSELPDWELPRYASYLEQQGRSDEFKKFNALLLKKNGMALPIMVHDTKFMLALQSEKIITPTAPEYTNWKTQHVHYMEQRSFTSRYIFEVDNPSLLKAFTSAFLHGGFDHLLGNMVVLFLVGFLVESMVGKIVFTLGYCISALVAAYSFGLLNAEVSQTLLGASGAIAGVMGMYTVIFGSRKIDFFYSLGFYFDYVRAPAIMLLPLWLGNELYQFFSANGSHVAYMAHFGGLLCGALIASLYRWQRPNQIKQQHQEAEKDEMDGAAFQRGMNYLGQMEFKKALSIFTELQAKHPKDVNLAKLVYRAAKADPASQEYHRAALRLLSLRAMDETTSHQTYTIFQEYLRCAKPSHRLGSDLVSKLAQRFASTGYVDDAEKLTAVLQRATPPHQELPTVLLALARGYYREQRKDQFNATLQRLIRQFPHSEEAQAANKILQMS
ncbi:rhomboid family intramembrane serine protease [Solimicrobium silvestre]|uniref:Rhomboid family n=1 Tax=Solimicrobium silvestre TaxID=2099400 RepID=A0A2S9GV67_9BURK|nr:rhomboid family intramembrane serine protease [Solimicrobium silvestre]PRC91600.1 Rhomboid family [Solimicrobium silvestre]